MARPGDTARPRRIKAEFDDSFSATARGGAAIVERAMRSLGVRRLLADHVPARSGAYCSAEVAEQVIAGLLCGAKGFQATELIRRDAVLARVFGYGRVAEEATVYRAMCDMAGLGQRAFEEAYEALGAEQLRLDMHGRERKPRRHRRLVPNDPEFMSCSSREQFDALLVALARRCARALPHEALSLCSFVPVHIDGSDLEVEGRCFDAARVNHNGERSLRLMSARIGPVHAALRVLAGASDEGRAMPALIKATAPLAEEVAGKRRVLALVDSAGAETEVLRAAEDKQWFHLIGANQWRPVLESLAEEQDERAWNECGADTQRGWSRSQTAVFTHTPGELGHCVTVIARRWRNEGELPSMPWHYAFLYTNLAPQDLPRNKLRRHGFAPLCWLLYGTKQGHENHFKTLLSDLGAHHPPSGRMGATEAFVFLAACAATIWAALSHRAAAPEERRLRHWRFVRDYLAIAATAVTAAGRTLLVRLAGGGVCERFKKRWLRMFACAGQL